MTEYNIYKNSNDDYKAIKVGWSWTGFFFKWFWALYNGLWEIFIISAVILFYIINIFPLSSQGNFHITRFLFLLISIVFGIYGNRWKEQDLKGKRYMYKDNIVADNAYDAIQTYLNKFREDDL